MRTAIIDVNLAVMKPLKTKLPELYEDFLALRFGEPCAHGPPATTKSSLRRASRREEVCA
ncbi:MAG: hypothetical protein PHV21_00380 [Synergistaceae bacterium]|nr:hypothetical protein [Synergistaceae bacterium]